jgi:hypothetical protein
MGCERAESVKKKCLDCPVCMRAIRDSNTVSRVWNKAMALDRALVKQGRPAAFEKTLKEAMRPPMDLGEMAMEAEIAEAAMDAFTHKFGLSAAQGAEKASLTRMNLENARFRP